MKKIRFHLLVLLPLILFSFAFCKSAPPPEPAPEAVVDPNKQPPDQSVLDQLEAAKAEAAAAREGALAVQGNVYFEDEWKKAETDNDSAKGTSAATLEGALKAIALYKTATVGYETIAENSGPLYAKEQEEARLALETAMARAEQSRTDAMGSKGNVYFPDEWQAAEDTRQSADDSGKATLAEIKAATALYTSAADGYDDIAANSRPILAKEIEDAERAKQEVMARERDEAQKELDAAMARAEKSRQQAMSVDGPTYFANDWKNAETRNTSAKGAKKSTPEEIKAATALFVAVAAAYDDIAQKSQARMAKDIEDANKALQAAITRSELSRKTASDANGQNNFPTEWRNAETKNQTAKSAKRATLAEIKAATPLYVGVAEAYDDISRKSNDSAAVAAKARAEKERQAALDVNAQIAMKDDFNKADAIHQQALKDFNGKLFPVAADRYGQAATQFTAVTKAVLDKRNQAESAIKKANARTDESVALATNAGHSGQTMGERQ